MPVFSILVLSIAGCTQPSSISSSGINDPYEESNREIHALNKGLDTALLRPVGVGYSSILPDEIEDSIGNFASNLSMPKAVTNNLLQGNVEGVLTNTARFAINSTLGFGGLFDVANDFGLREVKGDFGQTLHVWGVPEGAYLELPVIGPSTERDAAGKVVDLFLDPLSYVLASPEKYYGTAASAASGIGYRGRYADLIDSVLYDSADSYAQARQIYLQKRRFDIGGDSGSDDDMYFDPYEDPYAQ